MQRVTGSYRWNRIESRALLHQHVKLLHRQTSSLFFFPTLPPLPPPRFSFALPTRKKRNLAFIARSSRAKLSRKTRIPPDLPRNRKQQFPASVTRQSRSLIRPCERTERTTGRGERPRCWWKVEKFADNEGATTVRRSFHARARATRLAHSGAAFCCSRSEVKNSLFLRCQTTWKKKK